MHIAAQQARPCIHAYTLTFALIMSTVPATSPPPAWENFARCASETLPLVAADGATYALTHPPTLTLTHTHIHPSTSTG